MQYLWLTGNFQRLVRYFDPFSMLICKNLTHEIYSQNTPITLRRCTPLDPAAFGNIRKRSVFEPSRRLVLLGVQEVGSSNLPAPTISLLSNDSQLYENVQLTIFQTDSQGNLLFFFASGRGATFIWTYFPGAFSVILGTVSAVNSLWLRRGISLAEILARR